MKYLRMAALMAAMTTAGVQLFADRISCEELNSDPSSMNLLRSLYINSTILRHAFVPNSGTRIPEGQLCIGASQQLISSSDIGELVFVRLTKRTLIEWVGEKYAATGTFGYSDKKDIHVATCRKKPYGPMVGFRISKVQRYGGSVYNNRFKYGGETVVSAKGKEIVENAIPEEYFGIEYHFIIDAYVIIDDDILNRLKNWAGKVLGEEKLQIQSVYRLLTDGSYSKEKIYLINGTQFKQFDSVLSELNATLNDVIGNSCSFDLAAKIIKDESAGVEADKISVVGHSLGGAVAQYIAYDRKVDPDAYQIREFGAYSFNSLGLKERQDVGPIDSLWSCRIKGDLVTGVQRDQAGGKFIYVPKLFFGVKRHGLMQVQRALCLCMDGTGRADIEPL